MPTFRKKPVEIEARKFVPADYDEACDVAIWCGGRATNQGCEIDTLEGVMLAKPGDWIIRGVQGEFYPCKDFLGGPAERTMDTVGSTFTWQDLYSNAGTTAAFTKQVKEQIPAQIAALTGGEQFYLITDIQIDKPNVSGELKSQMERAEAATLARANAQADQDFIATFPGGASAYQAWKDQQSRATLQEAMARCFNEARCNAVPVAPGAGG